jgi:hypothetical protein
VINLSFDLYQIELYLNNGEIFDILIPTWLFLTLAISFLLIKKRKKLF